MRTGFLGLATIAAALPCAAQTLDRPVVPRLPTENERIIAMLQSTDAREQAWGAWFAGRDHRHELVSFLQFVVRTRAGAISTAEGAARDVALDALIQMARTVQPDVLPLVFEHRSTEALILASHAPEDATEFLMDVLRTKDGAAWFAAANLLLDTRPPGYVETLLRGVRIAVTVSITDDGKGGLDVDAPSESGGLGCGLAGSTPGLPPWPSYATTYARPGVVVLALGPHPVYYERRVTPAGEGRNDGSSFAAGPSSRQRLDYVAALLSEKTEDLPVAAIESHAVIWRSESALASDIARIRADVELRLRMLLNRLLVQDLLTSEAVSSLVADLVDVRIEDRRGG